MNINELKERMQDPVVRDHKLIAKAIEEMYRLPTACLYKEKVKCKNQNITFRERELSALCSLLNKSINDDDVGDYAGVVRAIGNYNPKNQISYGNILWHIGALHACFFVSTNKGE